MDYPGAMELAVTRVKSPGLLQDATLGLMKDGLSQGADVSWRCEEMHPCG